MPCPEAIQQHHIYPLLLLLNNLFCSCFQMRQTCGLFPHKYLANICGFPMPWISTHFCCDQSIHATTFKWRLHFYAAISRILLQKKNKKKKPKKNPMQHLLWTRDHCDISDSSNVITIRFYSGCSGKCITLVSTVSSLVTFKTTSLNWMSLVMRQLILVWSIFRSNPRHLMVIIQNNPS